nr:hypothetical protein [Tanacetum cinerariifolium]
MVYENCMKELEKFQDDRIKIVEDKFDKLYTDFVEMALHLEEHFYSYLLTTISGRMWLLTHCMEHSIAKCLNSPKYLSALGTSIGKAIEKGMQDGLAVGITHGKEDKVVIGATALSLALDASSLEGTSDTFGTVPANATTRALSTTLALTSTVNPISIYDYKFIDANDQAVAGEDAASFPNVDNAELHIPRQFR